MFTVLIVLVVAGVAGTAGAALGGVRARRHVRAFERAVDRLNLTGAVERLEPGRLAPELRPTAERMNRLIMARRLAELAARDASERARAGDGRSEQIARELEPALAALRHRAGQWREHAEPAMREAFAEVERELERLDDLMRGVLAVASAAGRPTEASDLCAAVRAALRDLPVVRAAAVTLDLDERPCLVPGTEEAVARLASAFLQHAVASGQQRRQGDRRPPSVGVYVRRVPRVSLEEAVVRRKGDPGLKIVPRRPNPRLERWLREGAPPAEVVKFIVADSGVGIPADIEKRLYDPAVGGGIGLTTARRVIEQGRGTVWVQPAREGGAALHVVLPLATAAERGSTSRDGTMLRATA